MATKASRIALAGSNISSTGEVDADLLDNIDSAAFLSLDSNGRLGIGTSSPLGKLHVRDGTAQAGIDHSYIYDASAISIEATEPSLQLMAEDSGTHGGSILWRYGNNTFAAIANPATDTVDFTYGVTTADEFQVHSGTNMSSYLKIMSIGADGNLDVNGLIKGIAGASSSGGIKLHTNSGINVSANVMSFHTGQANGFSFNGNSDGADSSNPLVVIRADGKVGIGTTAPLADLHVQGNAVIGNIQTYETTNPANSGATLHVHNTADDGGDADGEVNFGDETQVIISTGAIAGGPQGYQGSLWFGTSDHPAGGNTLNSAGTQWNWKVAGIASKTDQDTASENSAYGNLEFYTKGSNASTSASLAMTIDESQNVGIGKTDPSAKLHTVKATSDTITADTAGVKFDGSGSDGLAFGNMTSAPHSSWIQAGYLANGYSPAFNSGYPIVLNPIGGNIGIGITNPSEELHIYDAGSDPYVLVDGSGSNRDSGYKINAGNGVKIAARADAGGNMYFADNAILVGSSNGNGQYRSVKIDSEIVLRENSGTNPSEAIIARMLGCRDIAGAGGSAILGGQGDTLSGHALRKNGSTGTNTFFFGPYGTFPAGSFTALFRIKIGLINSGSIGQIDVTGSGTANASGANVTNRSRSVNTSDFINGQYMYFPVDFDRTSSGGGIEFRWLNANSNADVYLDHILIVPRITR